MGDQLVTARPDQEVLGISWDSTFSCEPSNRQKSNSHGSATGHMIPDWRYPSTSFPLINVATTDL